MFYPVNVEFVRGIDREAKRVGILAGSFNPPTLAHLELIRAALAELDHVVCVVPRVFPHKEYFGATLEERLEMLGLMTADLPCSVGASEAGLLIEIARECRPYFESPAQISLLCGADAAERIMNWDYGQTGVVDQMLDEFELLVAARRFRYEPAVEHAHRVRLLAMSDGYHEVSSTEVRERIRHGEAWEHLVPGTTIAAVRRIYSPTREE